MLADTTKENRTAEDRGSKDIKSLEECKKKTLIIETRARRSAASDESNKYE
ncbi:MAG: hypothetical protein M1813_009192 [Trichoglossum hirsutum]|nr:MAG: hypothetical protein M1813_009192 [Trichoglossum hirsutum]